MSARRKGRRPHHDIAADCGSSAEIPVTPRWRSAILAATLMAVVFIVFFPSLGSSFNYDDERNIIENQDYRGLGASHLRWMFTTFDMGHYQPLSWMSLGLDYLVWGMDPWGYHLTSLILHAANALLVYLIARALLNLAGRPASSDIGAFIAAMLFSIHPLRVESVVWVTERRDVLSSFFLLATILLYLRAQGTDAAAGRRRFFFAALFTYLLSLLSRAMGVTLPIILLILDVYPLRRLGGDRRRIFGREVRGVWLEKIPFVALAAIAAIIAPIAQHHVDANIPLWRHSVGGRIAQACYGLVFYIYKSLIPLDLSPIYELRLPLKIFAMKYVLSAIALLGMTTAVVLLRRRLPALVVAAACYVVLLLPVLGFAQSGPQEVADRYSYLPMIGWGVLLGAIASDHWLKQRRLAVAAPTILLAVILGILTWRQCLVWHNPLSLWTHAVQHGPPACSAEFNLANVLAKTGEREAALEHYRKGFDIYPGMASAHQSYAMCLSELGRREEAIREFKRVIELDPTHGGAHYELGRVYGEQRRFPEAKAEYREAIRLSKNMAKAYVNLGGILADVDKDYSAALQLYGQALTIDPDHRDGHYNMAIALDAVGKTDEAVSHYRSAIRIDPAFPEAHINLGNIFARQGRVHEAVAEYRKALRIDPNQPAAKANLEGLIRSQSTNR